MNGTEEVVGDIHSLLEHLFAATDEIYTYWVYEAICHSRAWTFWRPVTSELHFA
jgi:hypothetical protein